MPVYKPLNREFAEAVWRELQGSGVMADANNPEVVNLPVYVKYRFGGEPDTDNALLSCAGVEAIAEQAWRKMTTGGMATPGVALVIMKAAITAGVRFGMFLQRRAIDRGDLL